MAVRPSGHAGAAGPTQSVSIGAGACRGSPPPPRRPLCARCGLRKKMAQLDDLIVEGCEIDAFRCDGLFAGHFRKIQKLKASIFINILRLFVEISRVSLFNLYLNNYLFKYTRKIALFRVQYASVNRVRKTTTRNKYSRSHKVIPTYVSGD